ncbi:MAG: hypothetical protein AMXMBFR56_76710 [Polyangiaceae bacterium]
MRLLRRLSPPIVGVTLTSFVLSLLPPRVARAESGADPAPEIETTPPPASQSAGELQSGNEPTQSVDVTDNFASPSVDTTGPVPAAVPAAPTPLEPLALPSGADKSGVTSKSISVPKGAGTIQGMEESFSAQLSTGIATFSVPIALPAARGGAQPSLGLSYSSSGGSGIAGMGWSIGVPFIARQTDRGVPRYDDQGAWHPGQDRFVFNGGQELVPICTVGAKLECAGAIPANPSDAISGGGEVMPPWAAGYQYFRPRVEGSFLRFFWSPNHQTWRVQDKSGVTMELGVPLDGSSYTGALELNPDKSSEVFRWNLVRQYDTWGNANPGSGDPQPVNVVVFRYSQDGGTAYLSDIYDTPPAANAAAAPLTEYAHRTRLIYADRSDPTESYRSGWKMQQRLRLTRIDVASKTFGSASSGARHRVRRYHLEYDPSSHVSLLASVQVEGRCDGDEEKAPAETDDTTSCPRLPAMKFGYGHVEPFTVSGGPGVADLTGYEGFDERLRTIVNSPPHSVDEELSDLFDVNSDGLPDVLVTAAGVYGSGHGVFFNGDGGDADRFGNATPMGIAGVLGAGATTITLKNSNVAPLDLDGDGTVDLLHMPKVKTYSVYAPVHAPSGWLWQGREVTTSDSLNPKIDLGQDASETQVMDVDFDGLVDVVVSTGTEMQTFFALGRYAAGDGRFGRGNWTGATTAALSTEPERTCVPWSATPVRFSDPDIKVADMNGDGISDIVRVRKGDIRYWPGRGNGFWGTGKRDDCGAGTFGANRHVMMATSPQYSDIQGESLRLDDVNGDGLTDLVQIRFSDVDVWLNVDGVGWTDRHIITGTPASPSYANRVRLVDVNGSGTRDILWGNGNKYQYMDLAGGERPWILTRVENGLGKTITLEYSTSTAEMLAAEKAGDEWKSRMPTVVHVVKRVTESDNLTVAGRPPASYVTEYSYRDPVFEGRQREFRGFRQASAKRVGDENSPSDITDSTFLLGECVDETPSNATEECSTPERWRDNPREALKGLPVVTEKRDESGRYLSTEHTTYVLRRLYSGLDGREVRHAFEIAKDTYLYDTATFTPAKSTKTLTDVVVETSTAVPSVTRSLDLRSTTGRVLIQSSSTVDKFGNRLTAVASGCKEGCTDSDEEITTLTTPDRPTGDPTGWLWRTKASSVAGSLYFLGVLKQTSFEYTAEGALTKTTHTLNHTLPLQRSHELAGAVIAQPPTDASVDGTFVAENKYTTLGNLERETAPNNRCRDVTYDPIYETLATVETVYTGDCGVGALATSAAYDRGFGLVTTVVELNTRQTRVAYDAFGRLSQLTRPHPTTLLALSPKASVKVEYFLPPDLGSTPTKAVSYSLIHTSTHDGEGLTDDAYLESWSYVDGLGRTLVTLSEADPALPAQGGDGAPWVASGQVVFDGKGALQRKYLEAYYVGTAKAFPFAAVPSTPYGTQTYDAFGRQITTTDLDGTVTLYSSYHALSTDMWDAADLSPGPHQGTFASERKDGHGRTRATLERFHEGATLRTRETLTQYLPTGEPQAITRQLVGTTEKVVRWMRYDSQGRLVLNVEPNTSENFTDLPATLPANLRAWRYAYNDAGDLVGTSDARGCGVNFAYDGAGRLISEDYSPCRGSHAVYSQPNLAARTGFEVFYHYDTAPPEPMPTGISLVPGFIKGRLVATYDRASLTVTEYDGRGRTPASAVRIAKPGTPSDALATRYADRWYVRSMVFDGADRELAATTGASVAELQGTIPDALGTSAVRTAYTARGTVKHVKSTYGDLVNRAERTADGLLQRVEYGDATHTTTDFSYDVRRRVKTVQTYRGPPAGWNAPNNQPTFQLLLQDDELIYDSVGNPTEIRDWRIASEWPAGAKPVTKKAQYDDLYRVSRVDYQYEGGDDTWTSPFAAENSGQTDLQDPRRAKPSPHVDFAKRLQWQTFSYDWLGNTSKTDDDAHGFYDRSLGPIANDTGKPYQLKSADNTALGGGKTGKLATQYDPSGNLTRMHVQRAGTCLPANADCSQVYDYQWDEVGRLARARRWDVATLPAMSDLPPDADLAADLRYGYDAGDQRVLKTAVDDALNERHTVYVFESLELRRAVFAAGPGPSEVPDYELSKWTEVPYLYAHGVRLARVAWNQPELPTVGGKQLHVLLELGDHLGSTSVVLDQATGELVERGTYQAYGGAESDYRPERWKGFREDYRFTGKEEDVEVGLQYFGKRYYAPLLNRWVSADPLAVHELGEADPNLYAYVSGTILRSIDPFGLQEVPPAPGRPPAASGPEYEKFVAERDAANARAQRENRARNVVATVAAGAAVVVGVAIYARTRNPALLRQGTAQIGRAADAVRPAVQRAGDALSRVGVRVAQMVRDKVKPVGGHIDVGGTSSKLRSNLNPVLPDTGGITDPSKIPNLVRAWGHQISEFFSPESATSITSARLPYQRMKWEQFAKGAFQVMKEGGQVIMNTWVRGNAAQQEVARARLVDAFRSAGFTSVRVEGTGTGVMIHAVKPAVEKSK